MGVPVTVPDAGDVQPVEHELRDRIVTGLVTVVPMLALGVAAWRAWEGLLRPGDVVVFAILYVLTGLGVTVGFHRLFTHRSFKARPAVRAVLAVLGSVAIEGPVISWVADHRKHHAFADRPGDPHSPHVDHGVGWLGALRGLLHAHVGWLFLHDQRGARARYAPDLLADPVIRFVDRTFVIWAVGGLGIAFGLGAAIGGSVAAGLTALLWGGAVRLLVLHHMTYSINSICHVFGRRRFVTADESRNVFWLGASDFRGGLAQQPSRVPDLRAARSRSLAARSLGAGHPRPGSLRSRLGRRAHKPGTPAPQGVTRSPTGAAHDVSYGTEPRPPRGRPRRSRGSSASGPPPSSPGSRCW